MRLPSLIFLLTLAFSSNALARIELLNNGEICVYMLEAKDRQGGTADFQTFPNIEIKFTSAMPNIERLNKPINLDNPYPGTDVQNQWEEFLRLGRAKNPAALVRVKDEKEVLAIVNNIDEEVAERQDAAIRHIFRDGYQEDDIGTFICQGNARGRNICGPKKNKPCFTSNVLRNADIPNFNFCSFQGILAGHNFTLGTLIVFGGKPQDGQCLGAAEDIWINWQGDGLNGRKYPDVVTNPLTTTDFFGNVRNHYPILTALRYRSFFDEETRAKEYSLIPRVPQKGGNLGLTEVKPPSPTTGPAPDYGSSTTTKDIESPTQGRIVEFWLLSQPGKKTAKALAGNLAPLLTDRNYLKLTKTVHPRSLDEGEEFTLPKEVDYGTGLFYRSPITIGIITIKLLPNKPK